MRKEKRPLPERGGKKREKKSAYNFSGRVFWGGGLFLAKKEPKGSVEGQKGTRVRVHHARGGRNMDRRFWGGTGVTLFHKGYGSTSGALGGKGKKKRNGTCFLPRRTKEKKEYYPTSREKEKKKGKEEMPDSTFRG